MNHLNTTSPLRFSSILHALLGVVLLTTSATAELRVIISEIMYNPYGSEHANEYIEIFNAGSDARFIAGYTISDGVATDTVILPHGGTGSALLAAGAYAVILDPDYWDQVERIYDEMIPEGTLMLTIDNPTFGSGGLSNGSAGMITFSSGSGLPQDVSTRTYRPGASDGHSEERILVDGGEGDDNWAFSLPGGSPGRRNSITPLDRDIEIDSLRIEPVGSLGGRFVARYLIRNAGLHPFGYSVSAKVIRHPDSPWEAVFHSFDTINGNLAYSQVHRVEEIFDLPDAGGWTFAVQADTAGDEQPSNNRATNRLELPYPPGALRISEVMARPSDTRPGEWVEVAWFDSAEEDSDEQHLPLGGWTLRDMQGTIGRVDSSGQQWLTPDAPAGRRVVLAQRGDILDWLGVDEENSVTLSPFPSLNDGGDSLFLIDPSGAIVDRVEYPAAERGVSWVRYRFDRDVGPEDWVLSWHPEGGTPGYAEPPVIQSDLRVDSVWIASESAQPNEEEVDWDIYVRVSRDSIPGDIPELLLYVSWRISGTHPGSGSGWGDEELLSISPPAPGGFCQMKIPMPVEEAGGFHVTATLLAEDIVRENNMLSRTLYKPYPPGAARINEIMPRPATDQGGEWVELRFDPSQAVALGEWTIRDRQSNRTSFLPIDTLRHSYSLVVLAQDRTSLIAAWPEIDPDRVVACMPWAKLNNEGDAVILLGPGGEVVDSVSFGAVTVGRSLHPDSQGNWVPTREAEGGSPGEENDAAALPGDGGGEFRLLIDPNPFSPDGDGFEDEVGFTFHLPDPVGQVTLFLFDVRGRQVGTLLDMELVSSGVPVYWDGRRGLTISSLRAGIYVYVARYHSGRGAATIKGTLVSAGGR